MQKLNVTDYAFMGGIVIICIVLLATGAGRSVPYVMAGGAVAWCLERIFYLKHLLRMGVPTEAVVVNYSVKTVKSHRKIAYKSYTEEYQIYAPVLRYETETQVLEVTYPVYRPIRWFQDGERYIIRYVPEKPELFYFPEHESELTSDYVVIIVIAVVAAVMFALRFWE